jgi:pimeloyl-ACP methyl ester carboxylesterase
MSRSPSDDRPVRFMAGERELAGMVHLPARDPREQGVVFCDAFGDERRSSCWPMADLAREVAAEGWPVLRFDYWGCGESPGDFIDATAATYVSDIVSAVAFLRNEAVVGEVFLLGLRFGAVLAARAAQSLENCAGLILVAPVPDGEVYFEAMEKRKLVRGMITRADGGGEAALAESEVLDLDGYALRRGTFTELRALKIARDMLPFKKHVLVVQISFSEKLRLETTEARAAFRAAGGWPDVQTLVMPPFWSRLDATDTVELNEVVIAWLSDRATEALRRQRLAPPDK